VRDAIALAGLLDNANVKAFLAVIRAGEGTSDPDGYRRHFGGSHFDSFADHPRKAITAGLGRNQYTSTAAGAYQFLTRTWNGLVRQYGFADFAPKTQDISALALIDGRKALDDVLAGRFDEAVRKCSLEWASLPGSPYGQPTKTLGQARATYVAAGGLYEASTPEPLPRPQPATETRAAADPGPAAPPPKESTMPAPLLPILAAVLPSIIDSIPKLGKLFGSGSEVAERNVKAAEIAVDIVTEAVGARNAQEAAEVIAADPAMAAAARQAIESRWLELTEAGGGGIEGARKADVDRTASTDKVRDIFKSHSFWIALALLPLVYIIVLSIIGVLGSASWSDDVRASIAGLIVGTIIGGLMGYYFGQTTSRNRTPA
jgi:muramidase (phage lysozyme)